MGVRLPPAPSVLRAGLELGVSPGKVVAGGQFFARLTRFAPRGRPVETLSTIEHDFRTVEPVKAA